MSAPDGVGSMKKRARREGFQFQMDLNFGQKEDKDHFIARLDRVKGSLATKRRWPVENMELLSHLFDLAEKEDSDDQSHDTSSSSMLNTSGIYTGDGDEEQPLFVCQGSTFEDLVLGLTRLYKSKGYVGAIESCAEASMMKAIDEIKSTSEYETDGEVQHDSTANAYHTSVPCLSGSIHKIVGCVTLFRKEHTCAQTRELASAKEVLPLVISKGLNVTEVAHDNSPPVTSYIVEELKLKHSYDTWHGK
uniref:Uncharacterized protein n=1 Tax=Amphimedon queenslandica TaxID=400682 RepID=A0A1X7UBH2_AMPQE